jgi:hypothetical protein
MVRAVAGSMIVCCVLHGLTGCSSTGRPGEPRPTAATPPTAAAPPGSTSGSPAGGAAGATASAEAPGHDDHDDAGPAAPAAQAPPAAAAFAAAWTRRGLQAEQWWAQLAPLCTPAFAAKLRSTDPANVPASQVTGPPVAVRDPSEGLAVYTVPTNAGTLSVTLTSVAGRWLASDTTFRRTVQ